MDEMLHIGERLGSLTTTSDQHSLRLDCLEKDVSKIKRMMVIGGRIALVSGLWGASAATALTGPEIGAAIAPMLKHLLDASTKF